MEDVPETRSWKQLNHEHLYTSQPYKPTIRKGLELEIIQGSISYRSHSENKNKRRILYRDGFLQLNREDFLNSRTVSTKEQRSVYPDNTGADKKIQEIDYYLSKSVSLLDFASLEKRARKISSQSWQQYVDWMAFQMSRDVQTEGVIYYCDNDVVKMAGFDLILIKESGIGLCKNRDIRDSSLANATVCAEIYKDLIFSNMEQSFSLSELLSADEVWAFDGEKAIYCIDKIYKHDEIFSFSDELYRKDAIKLNKKITEMK